jgi:hypothetical protein
VLLHDMPRNITEPQQQNLLAFFERGVMVLHHALAGLQPWSTFEEISGLRKREKGEVAVDPWPFSWTTDSSCLR